MTILLKSFQTVTVADIFKTYSKYLQEKKKTAELSNAKTALVRFTVPGWSNVYPSGTKSTADEVREGLAFLSQVTAEQFKEALSVQEAVFEHLQIDKSHRRRNRSPLNQMVMWAETQGYFGITEPENKTAQTDDEVTFRLRSPCGQRRQYAQDIKLRSTPRHGNYGLGSHPGDFVNSALEKQLNELVTYLSEKRRPPTIKKDLQQTKFLLGWLHRERGIPLDDLRLESIVPFIPINPILNDYKRKKGRDKGVVDTRRYDAAKFTLVRESKEQAVKTRERIKEYLTWQGNHPGSDAVALTAVINVAKFLYQKETETEETEDFDDIPVIKKLRKLRNGRAELVKTAPHAVPSSEKRIPWEDALKALRAVQKEADLRTQPLCSRPLAETTIAVNIQRLLILLLFMASPPDRSRTIRELEVGRTFVFGEYKNEKFTAAAKMKNPDEAEWLLHLLPADSKTGDTYGETWDSFPDTPEGFLADGKTFYYYLDLWINQYRAVFKPTHKCLLTQDNGKPLTTSSMWRRVRGLFFKHAGVPVPPQTLRKMYVTYLKNKRATAAELEAAAAIMRHSLKTQSEDYDEQERDDKVAPIHEFHERTMLAAFEDEKQKSA